MKLRGGGAVPLERPVSRLLATKRGTLKGNEREKTHRETTLQVGLPQTR